MTSSPKLDASTPNGKTEKQTDRKHSEREHKRLRSQRILAMPALLQKVPALMMLGTL